jgi:hypothetical protein
VLIRQTAPVIGAANGSLQQPGEWQVNLSLRNLRSDTHYRLDERQEEREELGTYVVNEQHAADLSVSYTVSERLSVAAAVPFVSASWSIPSPTTSPLGPRAQQDAQGIGDVSVIGRYWLLDPRGRTSNVAVGVGVKMPTGNHAAMDMFPDRNGNNNQLRYVDQSVQPGDGGWGLMVEAQAFTQLGRRASLFGSGAYLANPRDTNGTPSLTVTRLPPGVAPAPAQFDRLVNSVPDQYLARIGGAVTAFKGIAVTAAYRVEGQRRYDLLGKSHGFRRPGVAMFIEPGISVGKGRQTVSFTFPIAFYQNRKPDPYTGLQGDATFPKYIVLGTYGFRFGGRRPPPPAPPAPPCDTGQ